MKEEYQYNLNMTLRDVREVLGSNLVEGTHCPCCNQYAKKYKRKLTSAMAWVLVIIYKYYLKEGNLEKWLHVEDYLKNYPNLPSSLRGDFSKLRYWGLIEEQKNTLRDDGSKRVGYYRITRRGKLFVEGKIRVLKHIFIYNNKVKGFIKGTYISIKDASSSKFDYSELMGWKKDETDNKTLFR